MGDKSKEEKPKLYQYVKSGIYGLVVGLPFGYALNRAQVYLPSVIQGQMDFSNFTMLKMFMTASLTSSLSITLLHSTKLIKLEHLPSTWKRNLLGGLLMGFSIYISGSCPGTVLAQVGSGITSSYYVFLGGLIGSFLYGYSSKWIEKRYPTATNEKNAIHERYQIPLYKLTIPFSLLLIGVLYQIERIVPWQPDSGLLTTSSLSSIQSIGTKIWSPYVAGVFIGLLQFPSLLLGNNTLGTSSAYVTMSSKACQLLGFGCGVDYFKKFQQGLRQVFAPMVNIGIILGSYYSSLSSPVSVANNLMTHNPSYYILSGLLLIYSSRFANACTSGHGLSGMAKMEIGSFISVASLFGGGMITSFLINKLLN